MEKDEQFKKRICELADMAYERSIVTFSDFLDLNEQNMVHNLPSGFPGVKLQWFGGYEMSERQMVAFLPDALSYDWTYPITCIHIQPKSLKFAEKLSHRDYLGSLINLGIQRNKLGDILVQEDSSAYIFCQDKLTNFFMEEMTRVKHTQVLPVVVDNPGNCVSHKEELIKGTVASIRLDSVISTAYKTSRSGIVSYIEGGRVFVNGKLIMSNGYNLKEDDVVSVRGLGKFRYGGIENKTKKGRYSIAVYRYV